MEEQFRIGGVYRQRNGEIVLLKGHCHSGSVENGFAWAKGRAGAGCGSGFRDLVTGKDNAIGDWVVAGRRDLIPGELHNVNGEWLPISVGAPVVEEKKEDAAPVVATPSKTPLEQLRELVEVQGRDGNWNYDSYMVGMFNGMELALAVMEGRDPQYRTLKPAVAPQVTSTAHPPISGLSLSPDREGADHRLGGFFVR